MTSANLYEVTSTSPEEKRPIAHLDGRKEMERYINDLFRVFSRSRTGRKDTQVVVFNTTASREGFALGRQRHNQSEAIPNESQADEVPSELLVLIKSLSPSQRRGVLTALHRASSPDLSPWAEAIGPLYTSQAVSVETGLSEDAVLKAAKAGALISIRSDEGEELFPVAQFDDSGVAVPGLKWITSQISGTDMDPYMLAAWLNSPLSDAEASPWEILQAEGLTAALEKRVLEMAARLRQ